MEFLNIWLRVYTMAMSSFITVLAFITICFFPESPRFMLTIGRQKEAVAILKRIYKFNQGGSKSVHKSSFFFQQSHYNNIDYIVGISG